MTAITVVFCGGASAQEAALLADLPIVEAATLHAQSLEEAPANVTVITAAEIRKFGYRTLAEALRTVRGFYVTDDRIYHYVGLRGFSPPGDYNSRFLVMINGHSLTDNIYNSASWFGQDFGLDMALVERIEIVRGPSSALYGSNGILANINVVTRSPVDAERLGGGVELDSHGQRKATVFSSEHLGGGANLLISGSVFNNAGAAVPAPEGPDIPGAADAERGYHSFANLVWRRWSFTGLFNQREKNTPVGWGDAIAGSAGNRVMDSRNFAGLAYTRETVGGGRIRWQAFYDEYSYDDRFDFEGENGIEDVRAPAAGRWLGTQVSHSFLAGSAGLVTVGAHASWEMQNVQRSVLVSPVQAELLHVSRPDRAWAIFAQDEVKISRRWTVHAGVRFDDTRNFASFLSPRAALVFQQTPQTVWKVVYGRPFRNPSAFEQYFHDNGHSFAQAGHLRPETAHTMEVSVEHRWSPRLSGAVNAYGYVMQGLIEAAALDQNVQQYRNGPNVRSRGVELEALAKPAGALEAAMSFAIQKAANPAGRQAVPNSPLHLGALRIGLPVLSRKLFLSASGRYVGSRFTWLASRVSPYVILDLTATTIRLGRNMEIQAGLRNAFDRRHEDPVALTWDRMPQRGRSAWIGVIWHAE